MKFIGTIQRIADGIYSRVTNNFAIFKENNANTVAGLKNLSVDEGLIVISDILTAIDTFVRAARVEDVTLPGYIVKVYPNGEALDTVTVRVSSKLKASYKYRKDTVVTVDEDFVTNLGTTIVNSLYEMFYIEQAKENLEGLNAKIAAVIAENEIPYSFKFDVDCNTDAFVLSITDEEIVFNASIPNALRCAENSLLNTDGEYAQLMCDRATNNLVASLKNIQTTAQLIKGNVDIVKTITGVSTKKRASKLIRESYHRQAKFLDGVKAGIGYFNETVKVGKEEVEVFSLVEKAEDGSLTVILKPFDVKTLCNVKFDVLKALK